MSGFPHGVRAFLVLFLSLPYAALAAPVGSFKALAAGPQADAFTVRRLDEGGYMAEWTVAARGKDGLPFIAYYDFDIKGVKTLHCGTRPCDSARVFASLDTVGLMGWFISLRIPGDGRPLMSHYDITREDLRFIRCDQSTCAEGRTVNVVDTAGEVGRFNSLALGSDGLPWLSYFDVTRGDLKLAFCADMACSTVTSFARPDTAGVVGLHTSAATGPDGLPLVAYHDASRGDLKVLKCGDRQCSSGNTIAAVDTAGLVGQFASMVLDREGRPILIYLDGEGNLKLAHCLETSCMGDRNIMVLVEDEKVAGRPSLALDSAGRPHIAYYASEGRDLKIVRCSDADCSGKPTRHLVDSVGDVGLYSSLVFLEDGSLFIAYFDMGHYDLMGAYCDGGGGEECWQGSMVGIRRTRAPGFKPAFRLPGTWYLGPDGKPVDLRGRRASKAANLTGAGMKVPKVAEGP